MYSTVGLYNRAVKVAVAGAGVIGLAVAEELASRGAEVRVFDPRPAGNGATRASAGMLVPYVEGHAGPQLQALCLASLALYPGFLERLELRAGVSIECRRTGLLHVALDPAGRVEIEDECRRLAASGVEHRLVEGAEIHQLEPRLSRQVVSALLLPQHGYVNVAGLVAALVESATRAGVEFVVSSVDAIEDRDGAAVVQTGSGRFDADAVVVASGSWSGRIAVAGPLLPMRPVRGQLVHLRFDEPPIAHIVWGPGCYLVPWRNGSLLVGATVEDAGFDERPTASGVSDLIESGRRVLPSLSDSEFSEVRVGLRPAVPDELPVIGRSSTMARVVHATGHYRNGVLLAPLTAMLVADLVLKGHEGDLLAGLTPSRFGS
jgi:glycine oxidase